MDYNQMVEGATLYLPVFARRDAVPGRRHAAMGDGEVTFWPLKPPWTSSSRSI